jgi:hypothetical protein
MGKHTSHGSQQSQPFALPGLFFTLFYRRYILIQLENIARRSGKTPLQHPTALNYNRPSVFSPVDQLSLPISTVAPTYSVALSAIDGEESNRHKSKNIRHTPAILTSVIFVGLCKTGFLRAPSN